MNVILLTALIGLVLVAFFIAFFLHQNAGQSGSERDALLPLDEEGTAAEDQRGSQHQP